EKCVWSSRVPCPGPVQYHVTMEDRFCQGCRAREDRIAELETQVLELQRFQRETAYLRAEVKIERDLRLLTGDSPAMKAVRSAVHQVARADSTVLIVGGNRHGQGVGRPCHPSAQPAPGPSPGEGQLCRFSLGRLGERVVWP